MCSMVYLCLEAVAYFAAVMGVELYENSALKKAVDRAKIAYARMRATRRNASSSATSAPVAGKKMKMEAQYETASHAAVVGRGTL